MVVTESDAQRHAMVVWDRIAGEAARDFPDVARDKELVDAAAALTGSLGIAPTGNIDPQRGCPCMFEPVHGSAFDILGKGLANPVGTFRSVVMLPEHPGETEAAARVMAAIERVTADPALHTGDPGGTATTAQVTRAVRARLAAGREAGPRQTD